MEQLGLADYDFILINIYLILSYLTISCLVLSAVPAFPIILQVGCEKLNQSQQNLIFIFQNGGTFGVHGKKTSILLQI